MIPEEIRWIYMLVLKHHNRVRVMRKKQHYDKALSLLLSSSKEYGYLEIIIGGSSRRRWRIKPTS